MRKRILLPALITGSILAYCLIGSVAAQAATIPNNDFSLEVSPSPLVTTVKPGVPSTLELKIHNAGLKKERLKIESRDLDVLQSTQDINISTKTSKSLAGWITYAAPTFVIEPGDWYTQKVTIDLPDEAGFSYPFAVVISRADDTGASTAPGRVLQGSIAVFTLINVDKPGAIRKLELASITTSQAVYEYLPATIQLALKNTGNSIVQPYGNIYLQNSSNDQSPLATLPVNDSRAYILPGATKKFTATWVDGFPVYTDDATGRHLDWDIGTIGHLRVGKYIAKVVAVYNDGSRDVPVSGEVSFWVLPWKLLLGVLVVVALLGVSLWTIIRQLIRKLRGLRTPKQS